LIFFLAGVIKKIPRQDNSAALFQEKALMRHLCAAVVALLALVSCTQADPKPGVSRSALETEPSGWLDLMPDKEFKDWLRVPIPPATELSAKNPWSLAKKGKVLVCDGVGVMEMLLHRTPRKDGIYHVEWRFKKVEGKEGYNGGVYVRTAKDGRVWVQAQVAHTQKPPRMADLFGDTLVKGRLQRVVVEGTGHKHVRPPGKWNTYEITCKGKEIQVWLNGVVVTRWKDCEVPVGHLGLQSEHWYLEFRNLKFKPFE
jgi:hypothetical protein